MSLMPDEMLLENMLLETERDCADTIDCLIIQQLSEYAIIMKNVASKITKRNHKLIDYDRHRNTVRSLTANKNRTVSEERTMIRAEEAFQQAQVEYEQHNDILKEELPMLLECQRAILLPIYGEFMRLQKRYFDRLKAINSVPPRTRPGQLVEEYEGKVREFYDLLGECQMTRIGGLSKAPSADNVGYSNKPLPIPNNLKSRGSIETLVGKMQIKTDTPDNNAAAKASLPPPPSYKKTVTALFDFVAQQPGDLSFSSGDKIEILEKTEHVNDWWKGRTSDGREGTFPGNYVS